MRKIFFLFCFLAVAGVAGAEELVIQLKSGNSIIINYSGAIEGVTLNGASDGIVGLSMPTPAKAATAAAPLAKAEEKKAEGNSGIRFRWAEPKRED